MKEFNLKSIAYVEAPYDSKFGVPRQSGIVKSDNSKLVFNKEIPKDAFEQLVVSNFVWVIFIFDQCDSEKYQVRPPRLGGNNKIGVYATRSPFRPNNIGLSLCQIKEMNYVNNQMILKVVGLDLANETPVIDIKPYHPKFDLAWENSDYWFGDAQTKSLEVIFEKNIVIENELKKFIKDVLSQDPRPAYHDDDDRIYNIDLMNKEIQFKITQNKVIVLKVKAK